jgi:hypothetical protein
VTKARVAEGRTVLVTGASAGIGAALARVFARHGFDTILSARRGDRIAALKARLESEHGIRAIAIEADLAREEAPFALADAIARAGIRVDALVNNAGYNLRGTVPDHAWPEKRALLEAMAVAPYALVDRFLPGMRERGYGRILNVASVVGLLPGGVSNTLYGGTKAMQVAFSEALHVDEKRHGVHVTCLCPGLTHSEFHDVDGSRARLAAVPKIFWQTSQKVAEAGFAALARNDVLCVPGLHNRIAIAGARFLPRSIANAIAARIARAQR